MVHLCSHLLGGKKKKGSNGKNLFFIPLCLESTKFIYFERTAQQIAQHKHAAISLSSKGLDRDPKVALHGEDLQRPVSAVLGALCDWDERMEPELREPCIRRGQKLYTLTPIQVDTIHILHNGDIQCWFCIFPLCLFTKDIERKAKRDTNSRINILAIKVNLYLRKVT